MSERERGRSRQRLDVASYHGATLPRGQQIAVDRTAVEGRFGRMFPTLEACDVGEDTLEALFEMLQNAAGFIDDTGIPAGFTYLGQFVDHDITFDPTSKLDRVNDPQALVNFRTPRFDLDNLYGSGPEDQPFLYDWDWTPAPGAKLLVGINDGGGQFAEHDLPRNQQGRALIGDARNDENLILAQLHLQFIRFHNAVVAHLCERGRTAHRALFEEAQRIVRWHYQWIVTHEFLRHIVGREMAESVFASPPGGAAPTVRRRHYRWRGEPFIPVEFSGAAYRFGHSMVRADYGINDTIGKLPIFRTTASQPADLQGFRRLPRDFDIDWKRFFKLTEGHDTLRPQLTQRIDTKIVKALFSLPFTEPDMADHGPAAADGHALPWLNLRRGQKLGLPSGQAVARRMRAKALTPEQLKLTDISSPAAREELRRAAPLWFYILCEAETEEHGRKGKQLGPVGGRIVAEVLVGLIEGDPHSYLSVQPTWRPDELLPGRDDFTMADLLRFAAGSTPRG